MAVRDDVLTAVELMTADPEADDGALVRRLVDRGLSELRAELLVTFVPLAFGRVVIAALPGMPNEMSGTTVVPDPEGDRVFNLLLADVPEFIEGIDVAQAAFREGTMPREQLVGIGLRGSELSAIQSARRAGKDLTRSRVGPPMLVALGKVPGFGEWYRSLGSGSANG